jgi:RimJ/RimL family protein N-acetyltransferase
VPLLTPFLLSSAQSLFGLRCYSDHVSESNLENWKTASLPEAITLDGRWSRLEPLTAAKHGHQIWSAVDGHDAVWTWLGDGPYAHEEDFLQAIRIKETGIASQFFAVCPKLPSEEAESAAGYASLMRIDAPNGVVEVGNIMFSPQLQRTQAATEAIYLMTRYVFEKLGYRRWIMSGPPESSSLNAGLIPPTSMRKDVRSGRCPHNPRITATPPQSAA